MQESPLNSNFTQLHRGIWANKLQEGDTLPVGGSIVSDRRTKTLQLDFSSILPTPTIEEWQNLWEANWQSFEKWFIQTPNILQQKIDGKSYFIIHNLQGAIWGRLGMNKVSEQSLNERLKVYSNSARVKLSDLTDGKCACAEVAVLGQFFLQRAGIPSAYMSGNWMIQGDGNDEFFGEDHSFIVVYPGTDQEVIWDISRPGRIKDDPKNMVPTLFKPNFPLIPKTFEGVNNLFIGTTNLFTGNKENYFGVSDHLGLSNEDFRPIIKKRVADLIL